MNGAVTVEGLMKSYGTHRVLKGLTFRVEKGEIFALLGVNGAGKTTALSCMEKLLPYDGGTVTVNGRMGIQLQSASLPAHIKAMEAIRLFAGWNRTQPDKAMLDALGMGELAKKQYRQLSTGQKRRLHLALVLTGDPDILFLDEPTAGLDVEGRVSLHDQIRRLKAQGKTILLASHDMAEVESLCDRIAILQKGELAFTGTVAAFSAKTGGRYVIRLQTGRGEESHVADNIGDTLLALLEDYRHRGVTVLDIQIERASLEQHFMAMTKGVKMEREGETA